MVQEKKIFATGQIRIEKTERQLQGINQTNYWQRANTITISEYVYTVLVTDTASSQNGKILPVQSRYGRMKHGDEVIFEIIFEGSSPIARSVHPAREDNIKIRICLNGRDRLI